MLDEEDVEALLQAVKMAATVKCPDGSEAGGCPYRRREPPHASGVGVSGLFRPSPAARRRFRGELFDAASVDVAVRFSAGIACGLPTADRVNNVGLALWVDRAREQDQAQGADQAALVALNVALFPTVDPVVFPKFLLAAHQAHEAHVARRTHEAGRDAEEASDPLATFARENPLAVSGILLYGRALERGLPRGYDEATYHGAHAFWFDCGGGRKLLARYRWEPAAGDRTRRTASVDGPSSGDWSADAKTLAGALIEQLDRRGAVHFTLVLEIAGPSQRPDDPSSSWPETLERFIAGELVLDRCRGEEFEDLRFTPWYPPVGICPDPEDHVMGARQAVYPRTHRQTSPQPPR